MPPIDRKRMPERGVPSRSRHVLPPRLDAARIAEQAYAIIRHRQATLVGDAAEHVASAELEMCRSQAAGARRIIRADIDPATSLRTDVRLAVVNVAVAEP